jgi:lactoylglutathione lyase
MIKKLTTVTLHVSNQDQALDFYVGKLGFEKRMDMPMGPDQRWVTIAIPGGETSIVLAQNFAEDAGPRLGGATGMVVESNDIIKTYEELSAKDVKFKEVPSKQSWGGIQALFEDPDGNEWVMVQLPTWNPV